MERRKTSRFLVGLIRRALKHRVRPWDLHLVEWVAVEGRDRLLLMDMVVETAGAIGEEGLHREKGILVEEMTAMAEDAATEALLVEAVDGREIAVAVVADLIMIASVIDPAVAVQTDDTVAGVIENRTEQLLLFGL